MPRALLTLTLLLASLILPACWSHQAARPRTLAAQHPAPPTPLPANAWPSRSLDAIQKLYDDTPERILEFRIAPGVDPDTITDEERKKVETPGYTVTYKGFHGNSLLRIYTSKEIDEADVILDFQRAIDLLLIGFVPNARVISSRTLEGIAARAEINRKIDRFSRPLSVLPTVYISSARVQRTADLQTLRLNDGLPLRIPPASTKPVKGLAIHLQSLAGNAYEPKVLNEFASRGWAIIDIKTQTSIDSPIPDAWLEELAALAAEEKALITEIWDLNGDAETLEELKQIERKAPSHPKYQRLQEVRKRITKLREGGFDASRDEDLPALAATIASELDQALAGAAYAVEGVLDYVDKHRPDLQDIPVVMLGFSAGALATPTAAARIEAVSPGRISAIVLVGGACNLFRVSQESAFTDGDLKIRVGENRAPKPTIEKLADLYLSASKLDPYHTAPLIAHIPVLQVHASTDTWVPASCGELLYERLNYPERLVMSGDHDFLFYFLPNRAKWIADWTERAAMPARQSAK